MNRFPRILPWILTVILSAGAVFSASAASMSLSAISANTPSEQYARYSSRNFATSGCFAISAFFSMKRWCACMLQSNITAVVSPVGAFARADSMFFFSSARSSNLRLQFLASLSASTTVFICSSVGPCPDFFTSLSKSSRSGPIFANTASQPKNHAASSRIESDG